jgi:hypothetical protein
MEQVLGAGASVSIASGALASPSLASPLRVLRADDAALLTRLLNRLVPPEGEMPGAGEIGAARFIDDLLLQAPHLHRHIGQLLAHVAAQSAADGLPDRELDAVLESLERMYPASFRVLLESTYLAYYSHPRIVAALGWLHPDTAGRPEVFDERRLAHVRARGALFREV